MEFEKYLNRRRIGPNGNWEYFCKICGEYKSETLFYKKTDGVFGIDYKCKEHYTRKDEDDDGEMDYFKLNPLRESDFEGTQRLLQAMGYKFGQGEKPIHEQLAEKYKHILKKNGKGN